MRSEGWPEAKHFFQGRTGSMVKSTYVNLADQVENGLDGCLHGLLLALDDHRARKSRESMDGVRGAARVASIATPKAGRRCSTPVCAARRDANAGAALLLNLAQASPAGALEYERDGRKACVSPCETGAGACRGSNSRFPYR